MNTEQSEKGRRVYRQLADSIEHDIVRGRIRPGDRLPAERMWVKRFGISRASVREAYRVLEQSGIIASRRPYPAAGRSGGRQPRPAGRSTRFPDGPHAP